MAVIANAFGFERCVYDGKLLQADDRGTYEEWHESQARAIALLEA